MQIQRLVLELFKVNAALDNILMTALKPMNQPFIHSSVRPTAQHALNSSISFCHGWYTMAPLQY